MSHPVQDRLQRVLAQSTDWVELRYHNRRSRILAVRKGTVDEMSSTHYEGVGVRVLRGGTWGFASTSDVSPRGLEKAVATAEKLARELQDRKKRKVTLAATSRLATGEYVVDGYDKLFAMPLDEKLAFVRSSEESLSHEARKIQAAMCRYSEIFEDKIILTSDGANCQVKLARPELRLVAFGEDGTRHSRGAESVGGTGGWECLFSNRPLEALIEGAAAEAVTLLAAPVMVAQLDPVRRLGNHALEAVLDWMAHAPSG